MGKLRYLILHCTATPEGRNVTSDDIRKWHLSPPPVGRGWHQVGYADMIHLDGTIENLVKYDENNIVDPWEITNGAEGENSISRHIVYAGGFDKNMKPKDTRTAQQLEAMKTYVKNTITKHPGIIVAGHNQFANKACPSFNVPQWLGSIGINTKNIKK